MEEKSKEDHLEKKEFHDPNQWEFCKLLEENWKVISDEFNGLQENLFHPWPESELFKQEEKLGKGWDVFGLYAFGKKHYRNTKLCPETTKIVENIPGISTAAFSILQPHSHILPHVGYYGYSEMILRCHLGISVPEKCWLNVGDKRQYWKTGKCLVFDDTFCHSAINDSDEPRIILLLDFCAGPLPGPLNPQLDQQPANQQEYLDHITKKFGYGVEEENTFN